MSKDATLHIKVPARLAAGLKQLATQRHQSVSELIRLAVNACFQIEILNMKEREQQALKAYIGGYISMGKLAEEMGFSVLKMRQWLNEHGIQQNISFAESDVKHA